ncbi:oligosaccharide flippase family protein [Leptospira sp. 96542]|nr:oligosaccharide flippase family protein [Leptospira sp. 96542]
MSVKSNIVANYISQIYSALIGVVMVPVYLHYMGAEAYGLVGIFAMIQAWFLVLDLGFSSAVSREVARNSGNSSEAGSLRYLLRAVEKLFLVVGVSVALLAWAGSTYVAQEWLQVKTLDLDMVGQAFVLLVLAALARWTSGLYRGVISGMERQVWLSGVNMVIATFRFVAVVPVFIWIGVEPVYFFGYQLLVAITELSILIWMAYRLLPHSQNPSFSDARQIDHLRRMMRFALSMSIASVIWAVSVQLDKLLLSAMLPLAEFGYFSIAVAAASIVQLASSPIATAILPRLARLNFDGDNSAQISLYRKATQLAVILTLPSTLILAFFPNQVLWMWTGDLELTSSAAFLLALYAVGSGVLVMGAFPYYLQHARGELRMHLIGNLVFVLLHIPLLFSLVFHMGMIGAGWAWLIGNVMYFGIWVPMVHRKILPNLHLKWLLGDITTVLVPTLISVASFNILLDWPSQRFESALLLFGIFLALTLIATVNSHWGRHALVRLYREKFGKGRCL